MLLFFNPDDLEQAKQQKHIDEMGAIVKDIIKSQDNLNLFDSDSFAPYVYTRRDLSSKILEDIDCNNDLLNNGMQLPFMLFGM